MTGKKKTTLVKARLPKGMRDVEAQEIRALKHMLSTIADVYERYGFEPLDTPAFEYTDRSESSFRTPTGRMKACSRFRTRTSNGFRCATT